jgi:DNA polymerase-1
MKTFKSMTESGNNLLLVDGLNMSFSFRGTVDYYKKYLEMINSLKRSYKADKVIVCVDKGGSSYRKGIYPEYKYNRKQKQDAQTDREREEFEAFFQSFEASLVYVAENSDYPIIRYQGVEADDTIAFICSKVKRLGKDHIWIVSSDRDLNLLVGDRVSQFSYVTRKEFTVENWHEHYDWEPEDYISIKILQGDAGDNVNGVAGIGPKRAHSLVQEYGSVYDIMAAMPLQGKYKYIESLNRFGVDNLQLNYQLMDLVTYCEEAIGEENIKKLDQQLKDYL